MFLWKEQLLTVLSIKYRKNNMTMIQVKKGQLIVSRKERNLHELFRVLEVLEHDVLYVESLEYLHKPTSYIINDEQEYSVLTEI